MITSVHPVPATLAVQAAGVVLALGRPSAAQAAVVGLAALAFLLANDARPPAAKWFRTSAPMIAGAALTTLSAVLAACLPGALATLAAGLPIALVALYVLATASRFSLPRRQNPGSAPDRR